MNKIESIMSVIKNFKKKIKTAPHYKLKPGYRRNPDARKTIPGKKYKGDI